MTKRWIGLAIAATLCAAGCKKDDKKGGEATGKTGGPEAATTQPSSAKPAAAGGLSTLTSGMAQIAAPAGVDRLLAALPMESEIVVGIDFARLKQSPLLAPLISQAMAAQTAQAGFDIKAQCGIDPAATMGQAVVGVRIAGSKPEIAVAAGGMDKAMMDCIDKAKSAIEAKGVKVTRDGDVATFAGTADGKAFAMAMSVTADGVGVIRIGETVDSAGVAKMAAAKVGDGLTGSKEFMNMVNVTNTKATIWALANGGSPAMQKLPVKFKAAFGSIDITDGVAADARIRMASPDEAANLAKLVANQLQGIKQFGMADIADANPDGGDVIVKLTMKKEQLENISKMVQAQLGRMGGAMGGGGMGGGAMPPPSGAPQKPTGP